MTVRLGALLFALLLAFGLAACSDDSDDSSTTTQGDAPADADSDSGAEDTDDDAPEGGGGEGTLTMGDEEIALGAGRCFLEEQDAAAGGGTIELTGQASGTNAAGDEVLIDFTRFSAESDFAGDDVSVVVGDFTSGDATEFLGNAEIGTVSLDGSVLSASGFEVTSFDSGDADVVLISFEIAC